MTLPLSAALSPDTLNVLAECEEAVSLDSMEAVGQATSSLGWWWPIVVSGIGNEEETSLEEKLLSQAG